MKCVQSLWTQANLFSPSRSGLMLHTLSHCLAKDNFVYTELVTDDYGMFISEILGWEYSSIVNSLNGVLYNEPSIRHMWARGKMHAILMQEEDFVHIDNDVLCFGFLPRRIREARMCAERVDNPWYYRSHEGITAIALAQLPEGATAYNCGMIGGTDIHLLHRYASKALAISDGFATQTLNGTILSMIFEQYWLGCFARENRVRVETLLPAWSTQGDVRASKWFHLTGGIKKDPKVLEKVERRLKAQYPRAYKRFIEGWKKLQGDLSLIFPSFSS